MARVLIAPRKSTSLKLPADGEAMDVACEIRVRADQEASRVDAGGNGRD